MDKYTVDLDQVLNDFEYSELTDQQSKNASDKPQSTTAFQPPPVTKHSINNVFHSLNEYLNSEINSSSNKVTIQGESLGFDQQNLSEYDNNLKDNNKESFNNLQSQLPSFNNTFEISGQNERLLKLKNEPQTPDILENTEDSFKQVNDSYALNESQLGQCQGGNKSLDLLELVDEDSSSINNQNLSITHQDVTNLPENNNEDLHKTDNKNFSLLDMDNEAELIPGLNCTENTIESEVANVNIGKECDKNVVNKADNKINNEKTNSLENEGFFECKLEETKDNHVNSISKINENKENFNEKTENSEDKAPYDNINGLENIENFIIEPSTSLHVLREDSVQNEKDSKCGEITDICFPNNDGTEFNENISDLESSKELLIENDVIEGTSSSSENKNITENTNLLGEELSTNTDSIIKEDGTVIETTKTAVEDSFTRNIKKSANVEQKIVGFSTDLDIDMNELNKILEDLEIEESLVSDEKIADGDSLKIVKSISNENQGKGVEEVKNENIEGNSLVPEPGESTNEVEQMDNEANALHSSKEMTDFFQKTSTEKPVDNKHSENNLMKSKESSDMHLIECLEIEKPNKNKRASFKNKEISEGMKKDHIKDSKNLQETLTDGKEDVDATETTQCVEQQNVQDEDKKPMPLQKQQSRDSLSRPQDLPLKTELTDEKARRKIDLIGSPGSTPYNNVYINKSIDPKATQDTDSDYTSSASPTFSDCSTESTSTASTVSVEDVPKNSDGASNPGHKNRHSDKTAVKNRGSQLGHGDVDTGAEQGENNLQDNSAVSSEHTQDTEEGVSLSNQNSSDVQQDPSDILKPAAGDSQERSSQPTETFLDKSWLGKEAPLWIPDSDAATCLHCNMKFTVLKRRHHCRACGLVLCSKCCNLKFRLEYLDAEARVCTKCYNILNKDSNIPSESGQTASDSGDSPAFRPNPNNPLEYCSTVSPLQQIGPGGAPPPSVMVPVGVLKRKGSNKKSNKSVMFCDGIAPGSDLTHLDQDFNYQETKTQKSPQKVPEEVKEKEEPPPPVVPVVKTSRNQPKIDQDTGCFIPKSETSLPPTVCVNKTDILYSECSNSPSVVEMLKNEALIFAINQNLFVHVKVINMSCCINKQAWCFSTEGLINVGSDEIVYLIEYIDEESFVPKDVFFHINNVYMDAVKGTSMKEQGLSLHNTSNFLDSKNHAGFVYIRPSFQCLENVLKPKEPYLIGILIHRWETPWAKLFPLRLVLRLGAEYRYYPSPLISTRHRDSVFVEIGHTIINLLADFRNFTYTLPQIRGLIIHMEDKKTTITIPRNRYDQVMKSINNSSEHILAFAGNFSAEADSHLVCIQDTQGHENSYTTHAINIHNKPRKVTGASFIVFNGSLKSTSGLTAKSNIVEDGLMIQVPSEHMDKIRDSLRNMKNHTIACGCINTVSDETVNIVWGENDVDFNAGVQSPVDLSDMKGVPSIRVHNGKDYFCNNGARLIRWTEVFILQNGEENPKNQDPVDISKVSESIAKACCTALVKYLDLLVSNSCQKIGIRATLHVENVSYSAGSNGLKLPPIYMRSLDNELVPILHKITSNNLGDNAIVLELIFRILNA